MAQKPMRLVSNWGSPKDERFSLRDPLQSTLHKGTVQTDHVSKLASGFPRKQRNMFSHQPAVHALENSPRALVETRLDAGKCQLIAKNPYNSFRA